MDLHCVACQSLAKKYWCCVDKVDSITSETGMRLVFHNEYNVSYKHNNTDMYSKYNCQCEISGWHRGVDLRKEREGIPILEGGRKPPPNWPVFGLFDPVGSLFLHTARSH